jgi:hypothetical protein
MNRSARIIAFIASALMLPTALLAADAEAPAKPKAEPKPAAEAREVVKKAEPRCEYVTGSRIRHDPKVNCEDGPPGLRVFTADDLQKTGEADLAQALRMLDPRMR